MDIATGVAVGTLVVSVAFTLVQMRQALQQRRREQQWKAAEFVAKEVKEFLATPLVKTAMLLLDYDAIALNPDGSRAPAHTDGMTYLATPGSKVDSLRVHGRSVDADGRVTKFTPDQMLQREAFDAWCSGLDVFGHHVENGLFEANDIKLYLEYWVRRMSPAQDEPETEFHRALRAFIDEYGYRGVRVLQRVECG